MFHQFRQVSACSRQDETTTSTFPVSPKKRNKKAGTIPTKQNFPAKTKKYGRQHKYDTVIPA
jgi:hypothetical protein